ncbi:WD40 repeat domain-containing protein [Geoalkalibacter sp.]|uniref:WD40 repeat domain-containing protein n=1 Tax=Geoalkalibacter sp. TaxID=3041440 RepID=UPI00272E76FA|nr:WD40 repeat domain-containing protein [Geoalkalibacter sp.]
MKNHIFAFLVLTACKPQSQGAGTQSGGPAMVVSVSSDGRFALSSHQDNRIVLWDLERREKSLISENANIYSAYFVRGTGLFLWQDLEEVVHIQGVDGKKLDSYPHFATYGHVLSSDLNNYVSSDANWNLFHGRGDAIKPIKQDGRSPSFSGAGKLLNLNVSSGGNLLLSSGWGSQSSDQRSIATDSPIKPEQIFSDFSGVVLWELPSGRPLYKLPGNSAKTTATLRPDGKYVVGGSENGIGFVWRTDTGEEVNRLASLFHGVWTKDTSDDPDKWYDKTGLIPTPADLNSKQTAILALRFIDQQHYLRFLAYSPYAVLYHIDNPLPLKYLFLGRDPLPAVRDYPRNAAMDTAPEAGILVMGQQYGGGIIVYRYDAETQELEKVWVADRAD